MDLPAKTETLALREALRLSSISDLLPMQLHVQRMLWRQPRSRQGPETANVLDLVTHPGRQSQTPEAGRDHLVAQMFFLALEALESQ